MDPSPASSLSLSSLLTEPTLERLPVIQTTVCACKSLWIPTCPCFGVGILPVESVLPALPLTTQLATF